MTKRILSIILALSLVLSLSLVTLANDQVTAFSDVASEHWAYKDIVSGTENSFFAGYPDGSFKPENNVTRAEAVKVLTAFLGRTTAKPSESKFTDLDLNAWYTPYIHVSDYILPSLWKDEALIKADAPVSRQELLYMATVAMKYDYNLENEDLTVLDSFTDKDKINNAYLPYIAAALRLEVVAGYPDNTIRPEANLTRAEFATFMSRLKEDKDIIDARRVDVEKYMRDMLNVLWSPDKEIIYTLKSGVTPEEVEDKDRIKLYPDRIYRGIPYSYAGGMIDSFMEYAGEPDENGVYKVSGLTWENLSGSGGDSVRASRIGNDCSSAVAQAWAQMGSSVPASTTKNMLPKNGFLKLGEYNSNPDTNVGSPDMCKENGNQVMFNAYSQMSMADGAVRVTAAGSGHAIMMVEIETVYDENGLIDGEKSKVRTLEQTSGEIKRDKTAFDERVGKDIYVITLIDKEYTFNRLLSIGYFPMTCKELIEPTEIRKPELTDSEKEYSIDNILKGTVSSNYMIDCATMEIKDSNDNTVQKSTIRAIRNNIYNLNVEGFVTEKEANMLGKIELDKLEKGTYKCILTVRIVTGEEFKVRDFEFTK